MNLFSAEPKMGPKAHAILEGNGITGEAHFQELIFKTQILVKVTVSLKGDPAKLTPGLHAVHIHEKGTCEGEFKCAGGHFDPGPSSNTDPDENHPFHAGDLPNIEINENGEGILEAVTTRVTLTDGPLSILTAKEGTALMIHGNPDP